MYRLVIERIDWGSRFLGMEEHMRDPRGLLKGIGSFIVGRALETFREQGDPPGSWLPRRNPNFPGIIQHLSRGEDPKSTHFEDRPALRDRGILQMSLNVGSDENVRLPGTHTMEVGVFTGEAASYAGKHQFGAEKSPAPPITAAMKERLSRWIARHKDKKSLVAWMLKVPDGWVTEWNIRPRPFLDLAKEDEEDLNKLVGRVMLQPPDPNRRGG